MHLLGLDRIAIVVEIQSRDKPMRRDGILHQSHGPVFLILLGIEMLKLGPQGVRVVEFVMCFKHADVRVNRAIAGRSLNDIFIVGNVEIR